MDQVSIEAAEALSGEEAFILQLRPPAPPGADEAALAAQIDQFTRLYLVASEPRRARFAQLAPLTWAIAASRFDADRVEMLRADLAETLFGRDDPSRAQLARQPVDRGETSHAPFEAEALDRDAPSPNSGALEIDDSDVFEVDAWRLPDADPADGAANPEPADPAAIAGAHTAPDALQVSTGADGAQPGGEPEPDVLDALAELERAFSGDDEPPGDAIAEAAGDPSGAADADDAPEWDLAEACDAETSTPDDLSGRDAPADAAPRDADAPFDMGRFAADLDALENAETPARGAEAAGGGADDAVHEGAHEGEAQAGEFEQLTEAPAPRAGDLAAELAQFREEMRQIADSIPGSGAGEALARFREEVESVAGAMGQRVDGAAQRIEAAADRILEAAGPGAAERMNGAADRTEASAALMEQSVAEAVRALKAMMDAAEAPAPRAAAGD